MCNRWVKSSPLTGHFDPRLLGGRSSIQEVDTHAFTNEVSYQPTSDQASNQNADILCIVSSSLETGFEPMKASDLCN